jgi:hypothetical protein
MKRCLCSTRETSSTLGHLITPATDCDGIATEIANHMHFPKTFVRGSDNEEAAVAEDETFPPRLFHPSTYILPVLTVLVLTDLKPAYQYHSRLFMEAPAISSPCGRTAPLLDPRLSIKRPS